MAEDKLDLAAQQDNFGEKMHLIGQIEALLKVEMHVTAERQMLEAELAKLKQREAKGNE